MTETPEKPLSFTRPRETFNTAATAGAAYAAHFAMRLYQNVNPLLTGISYGIMGLTFACLRVPRLRNIPSFIGYGPIVAVRARRREPAPAPIQSLADEFARRAGSGPVRVFVHAKGGTDRLYALGNRFYIGSALKEKLGEDDLKFLLAREVSRLKTSDVSEKYLYLPPVLGAVGNLVLTVMNLSLALIGAGHQKPGAALLFAGAGYVLYKMQKGLARGHDRQMEYRADRNALRLTGDFGGACAALQKLESDRAKKPRGKTGWFDGAPALADRIGALEKECALPEPVQKSTHLPPISQSP